jgi:uncharacterized protein with HEPN domain
MSKQRRDKQHLADIEEAIKRILDYTADLEYTTFLERPMVQDAVLRNFQVVGEATKKLSDKIRSSYPDVPWRNIAGMRDKIVHDYIEIEYQTVWDVIQKDLPQILTQIGQILSETEE